MNYSASRSALVAEEIRVELTRQRRTTTALSEGTGITLSTLRRRLAGDSELTLDEIAKISTWLGVPVSELIGRTEAGAA